MMSIFRGDLESGLRDHLMHVDVLKRSQITTPKLVVSVLSKRMPVCFVEWDFDFY